MVLLIPPRNVTVTYGNILVNKKVIWQKCVCVTHWVSLRLSASRQFCIVTTVCDVNNDTIDVKNLNNARTVQTMKMHYLCCLYHCVLACLSTLIAYGTFIALKTVLLPKNLLYFSLFALTIIPQLMK